MRTRIAVTLFTLMLVFGVMIGLAGTASAQIAGTDHDLTTAGSRGTTAISLTFSCQPCHHPHPPASNVMTLIPLGNRSTYATSGAMNTAPTYTMYSVNYDATPEQPLGVDLLCLSCHDGSVAMDAYGGVAGSGTPLIQGTAKITTGGTNEVLSGEHPIAVSYDDTLTGAAAATPVYTGFDTVANATADGIKFFSDGAGGNMVRCASCHDPHNNTNQPFLRAAPSVLCAACHIK